MNPTCQLNVTGHDGLPPCMYDTQVCIIEEAYHVILSAILKCKDGRRLPPNVSLNTLATEPHQSTEDLHWD